jgi:hypothetical protein
VVFFVLGTLVLAGHSAASALSDRLCIAVFQRV